jgi:hypothetical protein
MLTSTRQESAWVHAAIAAAEAAAYYRSILWMSLVLVHISRTLWQPLQSTSAIEVASLHATACIHSTSLCSSGNARHCSKSSVTRKRNFVNLLFSCRLGVHSRWRPGLQACCTSAHPPSHLQHSSSSSSKERCHQQPKKDVNHSYFNSTVLQTFQLHTVTVWVIWQLLSLCLSPW